MENLYHLITEDFRYGGNVGTQPTHSNWTNVPYNGGLIKETWNGSEWIEGATSEEIDEANKVLVPETLHRMGLKIQLLLRGIEIAEIIDAINSIPDSMFPKVEKQIAIIKFEEAAYFDRYNADLNLVAVMMGLTQDDLDEIFINGNKV